MKTTTVGMNQETRDEIRSVEALFRRVRVDSRRYAAGDRAVWAHELLHILIKFAVDAVRRGENVVESCGVEYVLQLDDDGDVAYCSPSDASRVYRDLVETGREPTVEDLEVLASEARPCAGRADAIFSRSRVRVRGSLFGADETLVGRVGEVEKIGYGKPVLLRLPDGTYYEGDIDERDLELVFIP